MRIKVAILRDLDSDSSRKWELACSKKNLDYKVVDLLRNDWMEQIEDFDPDFCVTRPPGDIQQNKKIFDEKIYILEHFTGFKVFPGFLETFIYENKAALAWFLESNKIPHPKTFISCDKAEALEYLKTQSLPIVAKTLIGATGSGVKIFNSFQKASNYVEMAFKKGVTRRFGPNRKTGNAKKWIIKAINSPSYFRSRLKKYKERGQDVQKNIVLFQEYIPHEFEWRCVKIGHSYFAYKKLKVGEQASGSKQFEYGAPPLELLDFTKDLCERFGFNFMAIDLFFNDKEILVNELQTIFGHKNPYICKVDDKSGRFIYTGTQWHFEQGDFNTNESYDLRLEVALKQYKPEPN